MTNRNRTAKSESSTVESTTTNSQEATMNSNVTETKATVESKLTSFNVTASVLRRLPDGNYKYVLSFRPTVRGEELWKSMAAAVKTHIAAPQTVERTDDHLIVADKGEPDVVTHWAIIRSSQRCPICGQPKATPSHWCKSDFCEAARTAEPTEKKVRRVEDPSAIDF